MTHTTVLPTPVLAPFVLTAAVLVATAGCSDDATTGQDCPDGEQYHPIEERCIADGDNARTLPNSSSGDAGNQSNDDPQDADDSNDNDNDDGTDECEGIECEQADCQGAASTSVSGTVTIPSGELPLPDVTVYVPFDDTLEDPVEGASCERCEDQLSGDPVVQTTTNRNGSFQLMDVPVVDELTVVVEVGKWRRTLTVNDLDPCTDNPLEPERTRLPANQNEGHLPRIAMTTGGWDAMECLVRKIGVDDQEFTTDEGDGAVHLFWGVGGSTHFDDSLNDGAHFTEAAQWWDDVDNLMDYDIVVHSCEGNTYADNKPQQARQALQEFTHAGGRVFLSHWQNIWLEDGPDGFDDVADWSGGGVSDENQTGYIDTSFPKGEQFEDWMVETGNTPEGQFPIAEARATVGDINEELAQRWVYLVDEVPFFGTQLHPQYFSFNTPVDVQEEQQCGRVVFSDIHVAPEENSSPSNPFPTGCTDEMTDQERALVFMFFDLSRCIIDDGKKEPPQ